MDTTRSNHQEFSYSKTLIKPLELHKNMYTPSLSSVSLLRTFYEHKKLEAGEMTRSKKYLDRQIKTTNHRLRLRRFQKIVKLQKIEDLYDESKRIKVGQPQKNNNMQSRTFSEFMSKKKVENAYLKSKIKVFGNSITERSKIILEKEINKKMNGQIFVPQNCKEKILECKKPCLAEQMENMKKYTVCHMILDKLLMMMSIDTSKIGLKYQFQQIFESLKGEMISIMINQESFLKILKKIEIQLERSENREYIFSRSKLKAIQASRKPFYFLKEQKKDELSDQIQKLLQKLKQMIIDSMKDISRPELAYQFQQRWNKRESTFHQQY